MKRTRTLPIAMLLALFLPAVGCSSTPNLSAEDAANQISDHLVAGKVKEAQEIHDDHDSSDHHTAAVFAVVYARAGDYQRKGRFDVAARKLRFLHENYPDKAAPRIALLYALMGERSMRREPPSDKQIKETKALVKDIREHEDEKVANLWASLVSAQVAIDEGRIEEARKEYAAFKAKWDGKPREMNDYTTEFERYFATHTGDEA